MYDVCTIYLYIIMYVCIMTHVCGILLLYFVHATRRIHSNSTYSQQLDVFTATRLFYASQEYGSRQVDNAGKHDLQAWCVCVGVCMINTQW